MPVNPVEMSSFTVGLDVGKVKDPAALCVLERRRVFTPGPHASQAPAHGATELSYRIRHLERLPLGTSYPALADRVAQMAERLRVTLLPGAELADVVVDVTGVGRAVLDLLRDRGLGCTVVGVNFTGGQRVSAAADAVWNVPKRDLVSELVVLFQTRQLLIAEQLKEAPVLVNELVNFRQFLGESGQVSYANDGAEAKHDDYVTAAALCAWRSRRRAPRTLGEGCRQPLF